MCVCMCECGYVIFFWFGCIALLGWLRFLCWVNDRLGSRVFCACVGPFAFEVEQRICLVVLLPKMQFVM